MSNPISAYTIEEAPSSAIFKTNTQPKTMTSSSDGENYTPDLKIDTPNTFEKTQSTTSPLSTDQSPSKVAKFKSLFKRRHSTPTQQSISTELTNSTNIETTPTSPTFKHHNEKLSLKVTFKEPKKRIKSSPTPLSTLNTHPTFLGEPYSTKLSIENPQKSSHLHNKGRSKKHPSNIIPPTKFNKQTIASTEPFSEEVFRNPTTNATLVSAVVSSNNDSSTSYADTKLKKTEHSSTIVGIPSDHHECINFGADDNHPNTLTNNLRGENTQQTIAMAMDKVEPVSSGFGIGFAEAENIVNTKQVDNQRMNSTSSPVVIKKVGTKQSLDNMIEDFLETKTVGSSPAHDEITPHNRNATIEEVAEESSEDFSDEDDNDHSEEESNEEEEERSSESEDIEETKPNLDTSLNQTNTEIQLTNVEDPLSVKTMISPNDLQTISYEVNEKLNESVQKEFNLNREEQVLDSFLCAYFESKMPQQGKMYITQNFVCFSSNIFGYKICLVISFSDIKSIEKKMTAMFIPNAIEIFLKDGSSHFFGSFVFRDNVYKVLLALYSLHAKARGNILISLRSANNVLQSVNAPTIKPPTLSDSSYATEEDEEENEIEEDEEETEETEESETEETDDDYTEPIVINKITTIPVETMAKGADTNQNQTTKTNGEASKNGTKGNTTEDQKDNGGNNGGGNNEERKANDSSDNNGNGNNPNNNQNNHTNGNEDHEEEEDDEEYQLPEEDEKISGINDLPPGEFFADPEKFKPKEISSEVLPVSMFDAWHLLKSDNTNFQLEHHKAREETNVQYSSYVKLAGSPGLMRKVAFISKVNNSLGPKSTRIECVERAILCKGKKRIINQTSSASLDVPFSDTFKIQNYWIFEDIDGKSCCLKIYSGVNFLKSSLLRWKIEDAGDKESKIALTMWTAQAKEAIGNAKTSGNLQSLKKGKPRKKKTVTKETKKRSKKRVTETKPTTAVTFAENPFAVNASAPMPEVELDLLTKTLNFVFGIPGYLSANITLPAWLLLTIIIALLFLLFSQQYTIIQTMKQVEYNVQTYKQQTVLFEQELNHLVFNLANVNTTALAENSRHLQNQIANWLTVRNDLYKTHMDNDLLHSLLYELSEIKKILHKKDDG